MPDETFGGDSAESYYDEGLTASMKGDLIKAVNFFEQAVRLDSSMATAYHQLGKCYSRLGDNRKAVKLLHEVVTKRPKQIPARLDLAGALVQLDKYEPARQHYEAILTQDASNTKAYMGLANTEFQAGNWQAALTQAQTAQVHGGTNFANTYMLGRSAKLTGDTELSLRSLQSADKLMEKYQEINPDQPEGHFLRGEVAFVKEDYPGALAHYRKAEESSELEHVYQAYGENFSKSDILAKQGLCLQRLGETDRAKQIGERILRINPDHPLGKALCQAAGTGAT